MQKTIRTKKSEYDIDDYIGETLTKAENFRRASLFVIDSFKSLKDRYLLDSACYLAAHAAELYVKTFIVKLGGQEGYKAFRNLQSKHDLVNLLNILISYDPTAETLRRFLISLNKYSGDKVRFAEPLLDKQGVIEYGISDVYLIEQIRVYSMNMFHYEP